MRFIRLIIVPVLFTLVVLVIVFGDREKAPGDLVFDTTQIHLGEVPQWGDKVTRSVKVRNTGEQPVNIDRIESSCTCSVIDGPKRVEPGQVVTFQISFDPKEAYVESQSKVRIFTDSPRTPHIALEVIASVKPSFEWSSSVCDFGTLYPASVHRKQIELRIHKPLGSGEIRLLHPQNDALSCQLLEIHPNQYRLEIAFAPSVKGIVSDLITLLLPDGQTLTLPITAHVVGSIQTEPESLFYGTVRVGERPSLQVALKANSPFGILRMETPRSLTVKNDAREMKNTVFTLRFQLYSTEAPKLLQDEVRIFTTADAEPIRLPVYAIIRS